MASPASPVLATRCMVSLQHSLEKVSRQIAEICFQDDSHTFLSRESVEIVLDDPSSGNVGHTQARNKSVMRLSSESLALRKGAN